MRQLQQNAATAVRRVRRGERIEVTDRGRPVAVLVPVTLGNALDVGPPIRVSRGAEAPSRRLARMRATER